MRANIVTMVGLVFMVAGVVARVMAREWATDITVRPGTSIHDVHFHAERYGFLMEAGAVLALAGVALELLVVNDWLRRDPGPVAPRQDAPADPGASESRATGP